MLIDKQARPSNDIDLKNYIRVEYECIIISYQICTIYEHGGHLGNATWTKNSCLTYSDALTCSEVFRFYLRR